MEKKLKIKDQMAIINSNLDSISSALIRNNVTAKEQLVLENKRLDFEKETKDRVDISLKQYEEMKRKIETLEEQNEKYKNIFERMGVEEWANDIEPNTIQVSTMKDPVRLSTRVHIQFESKRYEGF